MSEVTEDSHEQEPVDNTAEVSVEEMGAEQSGPQYDDLNTPMIALVGFVSAAVTLICILGLQAAYLQYEQMEFKTKVVDVRLNEVDSVLSAQKEQLNSGYAWVNKKDQVISMPIEQAMKVVAEQYESK
ncbi:hypothetical protein AB1L30_27085 [Bremerella sp. JC817]|uniref:hypothetical protein n=1 Tax=Bremerella sp. JC817 TaxID=3231756 RepID=UPI003458D7D0